VIGLHVIRTRRRRRRRSQNHPAVVFPQLAQNVVGLPPLANNIPIEDGPALVRKDLYENFSPGDLVFPEVEGTVGAAALPDPTPEGTARAAASSTPVEDSLSTVPAAVPSLSSIMGPYSPISPAASPAAAADTAETGDGPAVAVESDTPSPLVTAGRQISPGEWDADDADQALEALASSAAALNPTSDNSNVNVENTNITVNNNDHNNINLDLRNYDIDSNTTFPEIEGLDTDANLDFN